MKVFINTAFTGHYPVGTAAVVVAETAADAAMLLYTELLEKHGLNTTINHLDMAEVDMDTASALVLCDGNY